MCLNCFLILTILSQIPTDHSLGSLPDSEIFDLLEEFYAAELRLL